MNELLEIGTPSSALAVIADLTPALAFRPGAIEDVVTKIETEVRATKRDASTERGRKAIISLGFKIARSKTALDDLGKELNASKHAEIDAVDKDRRIARERLDALKAEVLAPVDAFKAMEAARIGAHEAALSALDAATNVDPGESSESIRAKLVAFLDMPPREWQEFAQRAADAMDAGQRHLEDAIAFAEKRETEAAELACLRAEAEERARQDAIKAQQERDKQIAAEAAEKARKEAETKAERERQEVLRAAAEERARVEREKVAAEERAAKAERDRIAAEQEAEYKRFAAEKAHANALKQAEYDRVAAAELAKRNAEIAAARAEREKAAAVAAEQKRVADLAAKEEAKRAKREANKAHRHRIKVEALEDIANTIVVSNFANAEVAPEIAKAIVIAIVNGQIRNVLIAY